jgi:ribonuclease PH
MHDEREQVRVPVLLSLVLPPALVCSNVSCGRSSDHRFIRAGAGTSSALIDRALTMLLQMPVLCRSPLQGSMQLLQSSQRCLECSDVGCYLAVVAAMQMRTTDLLYALVIAALSQLVCGSAPEEHSRAQMYHSASIDLLG